MSCSDKLDTCIQSLYEKNDKGDDTLQRDWVPFTVALQIYSGLWCGYVACYLFKRYNRLTHWGRVTHICISKLTIIVSDNGLSPDWLQAIIWNNDGKLLIGPLGTNFSEIFIQIYTFSFKKIDFKMSSEKCRPFCLGLNVLTTLWGLVMPYSV